MKMIDNRYIILFFLALIFIAPAPVAYFFYTHTQYLSADIFNKTNKGSLIAKDAPLLYLGKKSPWHLVLFNPSVCADACIRGLQQLQQIRLALGRSYYQVDEWLITTTQTPLPDSLSVSVHTSALTTLPMQYMLAQHASIFIVDAMGHFILAYPQSIASDAIYHDLKQLFRATGKTSE